MKNPKNEKKTVEELKSIVAKNLAKDQLHYVKAGQFGEEGVGYTDELPGLKASKSDQMEKVKLDEGYRVEYKTEDGEKAKSRVFDKKEDAEKKEKQLVDKGIKQAKVVKLDEAKKSLDTVEDIDKEIKSLENENPEGYKEEIRRLKAQRSALKLAKGITEAKKSKKDTIESKLAEIDKASNVVALEAKINAIAEMIESKSQRLEMVNEDSDLAEMMDKAKIKAIQKEIKELEKRKSKMEKLYEKSCGKKYQQQEIVDETQIEETEITEESVGGELKLGVKYELPTGETGYIMTGGSEDPKDWKFTANKESYLSIKDKLKPASKQPGKYDGAFDMGHGKGHHID